MEKVLLNGICHLLTLHCNTVYRCYDNSGEVPQKQADSCGRIGFSDQCRGVQGAVLLGIVSCPVLTRHAHSGRSDRVRFSSPPCLRTTRRLQRSRLGSDANEAHRRSAGWVQSGNHAVVLRYVPDARFRSWRAPWMRSSLGAWRSSRCAGASRPCRPAAKAVSSPVRTMTRTAASAANDVTCPAIAARTAMFRALRTAGRLMRPVPRRRAGAPVPRRPSVFRFPGQFDADDKSLVA